MDRFMKIALAMLGLVGLLTSCANGSGEKNTDCIFSSECPANHRCRMGACILDGTGTCPPGQIATPQGCQMESRCRTNEDCVGGRCVNGECFINSCDDGAERPCEEEGCERIQICQDGVWRPCSAGRWPDGGMCDGDAGIDASLDSGPSGDVGVMDADVGPNDAEPEDAAPNQDADPLMDARPRPDAQPAPDFGVPGPANDRCIGAGRLASNGIRRIQGDTRRAGRERGNAPDVWYRFTLDGPANINALLESGHINGGDDEWDTYLYLYRGECDDLTLIGSNDDFEGIGQSQISEEALVPGTYYLLVSGYDEEDVGPFTLTITFRPFVVANDTCEEASVLQAIGEQRRAGDTTGAERDYGPIGRSGDVWYRFRINQPTSLRTLITGEGNWDTYLYLLRGRCDDLERVAFNDDFEGIGRSQIQEFGLPEGDYFLVVSGFSDGHFGPFTIAADFSEARQFNQAIFMATHNSYSGGDRGTITEQLNLGVRLLELDIHDDGYNDVGDFRVGHDGPGDEVSLGGGNPNNDRLGSWLDTIRRWMDANPNHAPITIVVDIKDSLVDNRSFETGNLAALNTRLESTFGEHLFRANEMGPRGTDWPYVGALGGKVLVVLSGRGEDRRAYRADEGHNPAVAVNTNRQVVEVHDDGRDDLWYWVGLLNDRDGSIDWTGHGRYDSGRTPAVAVNEAGNVVEVHQSDNALTLWYRVGRIRADGTGIDFSESHRFDSGVLPSISFTAENTVREIHQSQNSNQRWQNTGVVNIATGTIAWNNNERTNDPFYSRSRATVRIGGEQRFVSVTSREEDDHLRYSTNGVADGPIRYTPLMFVEAQPGEDDLINENTHFFAMSAGNGDAQRLLGQWRNRNVAVRLWSYGEQNAGLTPHFPATDNPFADWYLQLMRLFDAFEIDD